MNKKYFEYFLWRATREHKRLMVCMLKIKEENKNWPILNKNKKLTFLQVISKNVYNQMKNTELIY